MLSGELALKDSHYYYDADCHLETSKKTFSFLFGAVMKDFTI